MMIHLTRLGQRRQRSVGWWSRARRQVGRALLERSHCAECGHCKLWVLVVVVGFLLQVELLLQVTVGDLGLLESGGLWLVMKRVTCLFVKEVIL